MRLEIKDRNDIFLAFLNIESGKVESAGKADVDFMNFLETELRKGISVLMDFYDTNNKSHTKVQVPIAKTDEKFPIHLKSFLERKGYRVREYPQQLIGAIARLLETYPDDSVKQEILNKLPEMSNLELTSLYRSLLKEEKTN